MPSQAEQTLLDPVRVVLATEPDERRRLRLAVNPSRFLLLPKRSGPPLGVAGAARDPGSAPRRLADALHPQDETAGLSTGLAPEELSPLGWLQANRPGWGIENGPHRLEVSLNEDRCRVRTPKGLWILGRVRRLGISRFMEWRRRQAQPHFPSRTGFQAALGEDNLAQALPFVHPHFEPLYAYALVRNGLEEILA